MPERTGLARGATPLGFALLIVLWTLVLVAFIVVQGVGGEIAGDAHLVRPGA